MKKRLFLCMAMALLAGCADKKGAPLEGREPVFQVDTQSVSVQTQGEIRLSDTVYISAWPQANANAQNNRYRELLSSFPKEICSVSLEQGINSSNLSLAQPVEKDGIIYALDAEFTLYALRLDTCKILWKTPLPLESQTAIRSVGLALSEKAIFAVSGTGVLYALTYDGQILGKKELKAPIRSAPTIYKDTIFVTSADNKIFASSVNQGITKWTYHTTESETNFFGMGKTAVKDNVLIAPFSNGDISAFDTETGALLWEESFLSQDVSSNITGLSHILAAPVINQDTVYIVGGSEKMGAYNYRTGSSVWSAPISGAETPVVSGNAVFMIDLTATVYALNIQNGASFWTYRLAQEEDVLWQGPVLSGDNLILTSSEGDIVFLDALTGKKTNHIKTDSISVSPIMVENKMVVLTDKAEIQVYK